ncbi:MAG: DUF4258 domain-containing protein [Beijerinckiaceae bacterium]
MAEIVPLELTEKRALQIVREIAKDTNNIVIIEHSDKARRKRGFSRRQIELCVQKGTIVEGPFLNQKGNWQVNLFRHAAGEELTCVVAIELPKSLIIVTVF